VHLCEPGRFFGQIEPGDESAPVLGNRDRVVVNVIAEI
jgi:hypothetical protein